MKKVIIGAALSVAFASMANAGNGGNMIGIGYLAKQDGMKIYSDSTGNSVDEAVKKDFPLVAMDKSSIWAGGAMASEEISDGRAHVRYWKNGRDANDGENTAWIDLKDVEKFQFDCCGDRACSGIKANIFTTRSYTDCFNQAVSASIEKRSKEAANKTEDIEKLKLQLEIEKLKLEQERLKSGQKQ